MGSKRERHAPEGQRSAMRTALACRAARPPPPLSPGAPALARSWPLQVASANEVLKPGQPLRVLVLFRQTEPQAKVRGGGAAGTALPRGNRRGRSQDRAPADGRADPC